VLPVVLGVFGSILHRWLAGLSSAADARFQIRIGCRLLDVPDHVVAGDLEQAALAASYATV
jgi:hypothetical protein